MRIYGSNSQTGRDRETFQRANDPQVLFHAGSHQIPSCAGIVGREAKNGNARKRLHGSDAAGPARRSKAVR